MVERQPLALTSLLDCAMAIVACRHSCAREVASGRSEPIQYSGKCLGEIANEFAWR